MIRASSLEGYSIPGLEGRIITTLFADDTTVYLSHRDRYDDLQNILEQWCRASRAKFNLEKTVIIPIGAKTYREEVINRLQSDRNPQPLPNSVQIIKDGSQTRILGAWIGNNADPSEPWAPVLTSLRRRLHEWEQTGPTQFGRRLIINMEVGGRTQYLTKVQGMPTSTQLEITAIIRKFMWPNQTTPPVNMSTLQRPIKEGGLGLLDLKTRVKAITLT
ncbi:hypothetical protein BDW22DRAFT_1306724, partial [Trametopsis cervina]